MQHIFGFAGQRLRRRECHIRHTGQASRKPLQGNSTFNDSALQLEPLVLVPSACQLLLRLVSSLLPAVSDAACAVKFVLTSITKGGTVTSGYCHR
jgi:hypothetical protein